MEKPYRRISDYIVNSAAAAHRLQREDGSMPPGHNGPWKNRDTNVRTTAHWAMTFYKTFLNTHDDQFLYSAVQACDYLLRKELRPHSAAFFCRHAEHRKSQSNGLIGQAWAIEPLIYIGNALQNEAYLELADEILSLHSYDESSHVWKAIEIDGSIIANDTLNQQLYFCAIAAFYTSIAREMRSELRASITDFLDHLKGLFHISGDGLFGHNIISAKVSFKYQMIKPIESILKGKSNYSLNYIALGYHSFILFCLGLIRQFTPEHSLWSDSGFQQMVLSSFQYANKKLAKVSSKANVFAYGYNPTGIEMAHARSVFFDYFKGTEPVVPLMAEWCRLQFSKTYNRETALMENNTLDATILSSRIYEAIWLPDIEL